MHRIAAQKGFGFLPIVATTNRNTDHGALGLLPAMVSLTRRHRGDELCLTFPSSANPLYANLVLNQPPGPRNSTQRPKKQMSEHD